MSVLTHVNSKSLHGGYTPIGTYHSLTIPAVTSGNSLVMILALKSGESLTTAPSAWNGTVDTPLVYLTSETVGSTTWRLYQLDNITTAPTSIRWKLNVENFTYVDVFEIGGTGGVAPTHKLNQKTSPIGDGFSFSQGYTTTPNEFVIAHLEHGSGGTQTPTAPFSLVTHGNYGLDSFYNANAGAAGSKTLEWSSQYYSGPTIWLISFGNSTAGPTVTSVTGNSATEGSSIVHTVTLSAATTDVTNYAATLVGVNAIAGTDFTSDLASATYSNGVTFSGGNIVVPTAVSSFTVSIPTTQDTLDEVDETYTLTIGGVASTGTILDNDPVVSYITANVASSVNAGAPLVVNYNIRPISGKDITAELTLTPDTAIAGTHYTTPVTSGMFNNGVTISGSTVTIPAGTSSFTLTLPTIL